MPCLDINFLQKYVADFQNFPVFVETGTFRGWTTFPMAPYFSHTHTIELNKEYYDSVRSQYMQTLPKGVLPQITFHLGSSENILREILPSLKNKILFFIDAHWCGGDSARGNEDVPLLKELSVIMEQCSEECVLIVDDIRLLGKGPKYGNCLEDYTSISRESILSLVSPRLKKYYYAPTDLDPEDRMIIYLNKRSSIGR